jgi:hypothetical protein
VYAVTFCCDSMGLSAVCGTRRATGRACAISSCAMGRGCDLDARDGAGKTRNAKAPARNHSLFINFTNRVNRAAL